MPSHFSLFPILGERGDPTSLGSGPRSPGLRLKRCGWALGGGCGAARHCGTGSCRICVRRGEAGAGEEPRPALPQGLEAGRGFGLVSYSLHSPKSVAKKKKKKNGENRPSVPTEMPQLVRRSTQAPSDLLQGSLYLWSPLFPGLGRTESVLRHLPAPWLPIARLVPCCSPLLPAPKEKEEKGI